MTDPKDYTEKEAHEAVRTLINYAGENQNREGLVMTPNRYVKFMEQFLNPEAFEFTTFKNENHDEMIIVKDIHFYSLCEHHLAPFFGTASIAYIPNADIICGISKIPRVLDKFARRLQNQERIGTQVADYLMKELKPKGVAVIITARHMCMEMRGIKATGAATVTSTMKGVFKTEMNCRQEFLNLIK